MNKCHFCFAKPCTSTSASISPVAPGEAVVRNGMPPPVCVCVFMATAQGDPIRFIIVPSVQNQLHTAVMFPARRRIGFWLVQIGDKRVFAARNDLP